MQRRHRSDPTRQSVLFACLRPIAQLLIRHHCFLASPPVALPYRQGKWQSRVTSPCACARAPYTADNGTLTASINPSGRFAVLLSTWMRERSGIDVITSTAVRSDENAFVSRCRIFIYNQLSILVAAFRKRKRRISILRALEGYLQREADPRWHILESWVEPGITNLLRSATLVRKGRRFRQRHGFWWSDRIVSSKVSGHSY